MQQRFHFIEEPLTDRDAQIWEDMLLIDEYDDEPLPIATQPQILLSDEVPF